jgi:hypothetical protein
VLPATALEGKSFQVGKLVHCLELQGISLPHSKSRETVRVYPGEQTKFLTKISWKKVRKIDELLGVGRNF